jgi:hypothetical protein
MPRTKRTVAKSAAPPAADLSRWVRLADKPLPAHAKDNKHALLPAERVVAAVATVGTDAGYARVKVLREKDQQTRMYIYVEQGTDVGPEGRVATTTISIGKQPWGRGKGWLRARVGVRRCGALDPHTFAVVFISSGIIWRGKDLVALALALARWCGCTRVLLSDGAVVGCSSGELYDLSLFMIARHGALWYMRLGFMPALHPGVACGGDSAALAARAVTAVSEVAHRAMTITVGDVLADTRAIASAIRSARDGAGMETLAFDEDTIWKREKKISRADPQFGFEQVRAAFAVLRHMEAIESTLAVKKSRAVAAGAESIFGRLVRLQKEDCSHFFDLYSHLFDNETYYWRSPRCMFHVRVGAAVFRFRLAEVFQQIVALLDPSESGQMWFERALDA